MAGAARARGGSGAPRTRLAVRVRPAARRDGFAGWMADGTLKLNVSEAAEDGRANRAVEGLLARVLGLKQGQVKVARGASSRAKVIEVDGVDEHAVRTRLEAAWGRRGDADGQ